MAFADLFNILIRMPQCCVVCRSGLQEDPHFKQIFDGFLGDLRCKISSRCKQLYIYSLNDHSIRSVADNSNILQNS